MREAALISELRRALRRQGVWGARAERLLQDWTEHARETAAQRIADGAPLAAAQEAAWQALGEPRTLAAQAARELARGSWLGRRPWLGGLVLPAVAWFLVVAIASAGGAWFVETFQTSHEWVAHAPFIACWEFSIDWVPWLLSVAWLAWLVRRMPGGWKLYWITGLALTLLSTSLWAEIRPPTHGPNTGTLLMTLGGILGALATELLTLFHVLERAQAAGKTIYPFPPTLVPWIQTALSLAGLLGVRAWSRAAGADAPRRPA